MIQRDSQAGVGFAVTVEDLNMLNGHSLRRMQQPLVRRLIPRLANLDYRQAMQAIVAIGLTMR
jgi:hypothetical protein